jgi:ligand-binding sensor domain-containing protein/signal transduction histidine kinase
MRPAAMALLTAAIVLCVAAPAQALDPERALSQYIRDQWGSERGFPGGPVYALTQTADGYLWIGTEKGLVRFDGLSFRLFDPSASTAAAGPTVLGVATAPDGSLWARLRGPALIRLHNGSFESLFSTVGLPESVVTAMLRGRGNDLLLATLNYGALAYRAGQYIPIAPANSIPTSSFIISMAQSDDGDVWLGTRDGGLLRIQGQRVTRITRGLPDQKINSLLPGEHGDLWIGTDKGVVRWAGGEVSSAGVPEALASVPALAMIRDGQSNVWIAAGARGLLRVNRRGVTALKEIDARAESSVTALLEDREGNLWVGTTKGIERLRDGVFTTYGVAQGLPSDSVGPLYVDSAHRTWFAPSEGGLYWLRDGEVARVNEPGLRDDVVYSIAGNGTDVWIGRQRGGLTHLRPQANGSFGVERLTHADGLAQNSVYAVHQARDGAVWAGTLSGGVSRFANGAFTTYTTSDGLASNTVTSIAESPDGTMWFGTPNGVSTRSRDGWRHYAATEGLPSNDVNVLFEDDEGHVWAGTANGLAVSRAGRFEVPPSLPPVLRGSILGLAQDRQGWLWAATTDRVVRVRLQEETAKAPAETGVHEYSVADGLMAVEGVKRHRSVIADARGRIWFATGRGLSMADPDRVREPVVPTLIHVERMSADTTPIDMYGSPRVPAGSRRVTLAYAGLSLAVPERVMFRYRLDGLDSDWSEPARERQAVFTNLSPGPYVFRVTASNADGSWSGTEATVRFDVESRVWQIAWFQALVVFACATAGWAVYRLRVAHVARRLQTRFEERLAERTRIAQALHDTLLQGFISASMQLHVVADRLPDDSPSKLSLSRVLDLMQRVTEEGRNAVQGLRASSSVPRDLEQAFSLIHRELDVSEQTAYRVIIDGRARSLNPIIRDEVYRIGREALVNAFRHAGARTVEVELEYTPRDLRMLVRDDGCGIDPEVVRLGRDGHWGLTGMRERAEAIGATFKVRSRVAAGTEVELTVPGSVAFDSRTSDHRTGWLNALRPRARPRRDHDIGKE